MPEKFDRMVEHIKESLRKLHPNWDSSKISDAAYGAAIIRWKAKYGQLPSRGK